MNLITPAFKRPSPLAACFLLGLFSILAAGCEAKKTSATSAPTSREAELTKTVEELRGKLAASEQALEQAKARTAALEQLKHTSGDQTKAGVAADNPPAAETQNKDTSYVVVKKEFTVGQLIPVTNSNPNATERRPAEYRITFKGGQSGKEYPALAVKETAYNEFREGLSYSAQDLNLAKTTAPANGTTAASPQPSGNGNLGETEARSIFGNLTP